MRQKLKHLFIVTAMLPVILCAHAADNMRFHGTLVAQPCVIQPGEDVISLDFGTVIDKYLYQNQRTSSQQFVLHLSGCNLSLGTSVGITFTGVENLTLPGLLALDAASQASGIAIGIKTQDGIPLAINKAEMIRYPLSAGDNFIRMQAYVQAEPAAFTNRTITKGPFSAVVTFSLAYE